MLHLHQIHISVTLLFETLNSEYYENMPCQLHFIGLL